MEIVTSNGYIQFDVSSYTVSIILDDEEVVYLTEDQVAELNDLLADWLIKQALRRIGHVDIP